MRCATGGFHIPSFFKLKQRPGEVCRVPHPTHHLLDVFVEVSKPGKTLSESSKTFGVFCANPLVFFFFLTPAGCFVGLAENDKLCFFLFSSLPAAGHRRERLRKTPMSLTILLTIPQVLNINGPECPERFHHPRSRMTDDENNFA